MLKNGLLLSKNKRTSSSVIFQGSVFTGVRFNNFFVSDIQNKAAISSNYPFSTSGGIDQGKKEGGKEGCRQKHLAKVLYRQILRWCDTTTYDVPFDPTPPVTLVPPRIDQDALSKLAMFRNKDELNHTAKPNYDGDVTEGEQGYYRYINDLLPPYTIFHSNGKMITIPLNDAADLRSLIRVVYRINSQTNEDIISKDELHQLMKDRVSLGFDVLRSLTDLSEVLEKRKEKRYEHLDRDGINFKVGQVVQHKSDRWRGVVTGWKHLRDNITADGEVRKSSLTLKNYPFENNPSVNSLSKTIQYDLLVDSGDAHLLESRPYHQALQNELEPVTDPSLCRIRSHWVQSKFDRYDNKTHSFSPSRTLAYEYPMDRNLIIPTHKGRRNTTDGSSINLKNEISKWNHNTDKIDLILLSDSITNDIQEISSKLKRHLDAISQGEKGKSSTILSFVKKHLENLITGNTTKYADQLGSSVRLPSHASSFERSISHLRGLLNIVLYIYDLLWHRQNSLLHKNRVPISLGSIVRHKKYGYRGVVVGWDPYPTVDVSRWDGLKDVKGNVNDMPFYHVVPDNNDCLRIFGSERKFRYVCDENIEICHSQLLKDMDLDIGLDYADGWEIDEEKNRMIVPQYFKFKFGESLEEDDDITSRSLQRIEEELTQKLIDIRDKSSGGGKSDGLAIVNLFQLLQSSENLTDATVLEEFIREIWKVHENPSSRWKLENGIVALLHGNHTKALSIFKELIVDDPTYFEAWNRMATCYYLLGNMEQSCEAAQRTVELQPLHYQAFNGLGLSYYETGQYLKSIEAFRYSMILDPWSPSSSKLSACLDLARQSKEENSNNKSD